MTATNFIICLATMHPDTPTSIFIRIQVYDQPNLYTVGEVTGASSEANSVRNNHELDF